MPDLQYVDVFKRLLSQLLVTLFYLLAKASFTCIWHLAMLILYTANIVSSLFIGSSTSAAIVSHELYAALCLFKIISRKPHSVTVLHNHTTHTPWHHLLLSILLKSTAGCMKAAIVHQEELDHSYTFPTCYLILFLYCAYV